MKKRLNRLVQSSQNILERLPVPILIVIMAIMYEPIIPSFLKVSNIIFENLPESDPTLIRSIFISAIFCIGLIYLTYRIVNNFRPTIKSLFAIVAILSFYFLQLRTERRLYFFKLEFVDQIYLADLIVLFLCIFFAEYHIKYQKNSKLHFGLIADNSRISFDDDKLLRKAQVEEIVKMISLSSLDNAIGISIVGDWGSGKTVFLNFLSEKLKNDSTILINFNPWLARQHSSLISFFFETLEISINKFDTKIANQINKYSNDILLEKDDDSMLVKFFKLVSGVFIPNLKRSTIYDQKTLIGKSLDRIGKKVIVFVDDLDRVSSEEILDVTTLIRNTADFKNMVFIAAIDLDYINKSLSKELPNLDIDKYLEKIFQLQIMLPGLITNMVKEVLESELISFLNNNQGEYEFPENFIDNFKKSVFSVSSYQSKENDLFDSYDYLHRGILEECIQNIRDVKRFLNSFILSYQLSKNEVDLTDLILLELLKLKFPNVYLKIAKGQIIKFSKKNRGTWEFDETYLKSEKLNENGDTVVSILNRLFSESPQGIKPPVNSIVYLDNHKKYFNHNLFGDISFKRIMSEKPKGIEGLRSYLLEVLEYKTDMIDEDLEELVKQKRVSKFFSVLIQLADGMFDTIQIFEAIELLNCNRTFYFPENLMRFLISASKLEPNYDKIKEKTLSAIFKSTKLTLYFKANVLQSMFYDNNDSAYFLGIDLKRNLIENTLITHFTNKNGAAAEETSLQNIVYQLVRSLLEMSIKNNSDNGFSTTALYYRTYIAKNPEIFLLRILDFEESRDYLEVSSFVTAFFKSLANAISYKEGLLEYLTDVSKFELARLYKLHFSSPGDLETFAIEKAKYIEAVQKDKLRSLIPRPSTKIRDSN